tara:strand:+ start:2712 stop:3014 length:303 start_codon:yes stop_codon:yes gene_type:complete
MSILSTTKEILRPYVIRNRVAGAFRSIFNPSGALFEEQKIVLKELNTFAYANATHHSNDPICIARIAGRREMYNWIVGLTDYDAFDLEQLMRQMEGYENE